MKNTPMVETMFIQPQPGYIRVGKDATRHAIETKHMLDDKGHIEADDP